MNRPEVMIGAAQTRFHDGGRLIDGKSRELIAAFLVKLHEWTLKLPAWPASPGNR